MLFSRIVKLEVHRMTRWISRIIFIERWFNYQKSAIGSQHILIVLSGFRSCPAARDTSQPFWPGMIDSLDIPDLCLYLLPHRQYCVHHLASNRTHELPGLPNVCFRKDLCRHCGDRGEGDSRGLDKCQSCLSPFIWGTVHEYAEKNHPGSLSFSGRHHGTRSCGPGRAGTNPGCRSGFRDFLMILSSPWKKQLKNVLRGEVYAGCKEFQ